MNKQEAIKELEIEYIGDTEAIRDAKDMAIEALSDPHNCEGCKHEEMWSEACEKCGRPMVDNYVKESDKE